MSPYFSKEEFKQGIFDARGAKINIGDLLVGIKTDGDFPGPHDLFICFRNEDTGQVEIRDLTNWNVCMVEVGCDVWTVGNYSKHKALIGDEYRFKELAELFTEE